MASPSADRINARAAKDRAFLKRALKNPGLRAKLDPKYLSGTQRAQRTLNTRLNAPITPGSATTERDLAHAAQAATDVRYAPQESQLGQQLGVAQQTERDTGSFYDQYRQALQQHSANVQAYQAGAQAALSQTAQGITGLAGTQAAQMQQSADQQAAQQGVAPAGNLLGDANAAAAIRQALIGSFQGQQAQSGAAANTYADTQANVVAPGQKLSALAQAAGRTKDVRKSISDLKAEEGAYNQSFRDTRRQDEFKNVLAQQTLSGNQAIAATNAATSASKAAAASDPSVAAAKTSASASATQAAKYGYTAHQWALLGPNGRQRVIKASKSSSTGSGSDTVYTSGPFAGRKRSEIAALSDGERQKIVKDYNQGGKPGAGPSWQTNAQQGQAASDAVNLKDLAKKAREGTKFSPGPNDRPGTGTKLNRQQAVQKIQQSANIRDPALLSAALDAVYLVPPRLSAGTIKKLIAAGYKPSKIAGALGVPTAGQVPRSTGAAGYNKGDRPG